MDKSFYLDTLYPLQDEVLQLISKLDTGFYLTGGTANLHQLSSAIGRRARVSVEVIAPTERIPVEGKEVDTELLNLRSAQLCVALGLSMRRKREKRL